MAKGEDITTKYKVDISDLKKNITEANTLIKESNSIFNKSVAGLDNWSNSASGLSAKIKQLQSNLEAQTSKLTAYQKQLDTAKKYEQEASKSVLALKEALNKAKAEYGESSEEVKKLEKQLLEAEKAENSMKKQVSDLTVTVNNQEAVVEKTKKEIGNYEKALESAKNEEEKSKTATANLTKKIEEQKKELNELKSKYQDVVLQQGKNSDKAKELAKEIENLSGELKENKTKLDDTSKSVDELDKSLKDIDTETLSDGFTIMKGALASLVADGIRKATSAVKDFIKDSLEVGKGFDSAMSKVSAISGATGEELEKLRDKASEMGAKTKFSATESAEAMNYMAMAGWKATDMLNGIEGIMNLAAASGEDLATTSDIVTDALTAFGMSAEESTHFADVLARTSSNANTNVGLMGETFKYVAAVGGALGYSVEDVGLAIGVMANSGIKASNAGTSLRAIMTRLSTDAGASSKQLGALGILTKKLGVEFYDSKGNVRDFSDVLDETRVAWAGLTAEEQNNYAKKIAGQEALSGFLALMNAEQSDWDKLKDSINNANGAAEEMAETMQDNLEGDMTKLGSKMEGIKKTVYEYFEPSLRKGTVILDKLADGLKWVSEHLEWIAPIVTGVATAFGVLATALAIQGLITGVTKAMKLLNKTILANPILLVTAVIAGLVASFIHLWNTSEAFRNFWISLWDKIKNTCSKAWERIKDFFSSAWESIQENFVSAWKNVQETWNGLCGFFSEMWENIKNTFSEIGTWFSEKFTEAKESVVNLFSTLAQWFSDNVVEPIKNFFSPLLEWFTDLFQSIWNFIASVFKVIAELAQGCWNAIVLIWGIASDWFDENIVQPLTKFFTDLWDFIKEKANDAWSGIKEVWEIVSNWFSENIVEPTKTFFSEMWNTIKEKANDAWNSIKEVWNIASNWFSENIVNPVKDKFTEMWDSLKTGASNAWEGIKSTFSTVANFFKNTFQSAWQKVKEVFSTGGQIFDGIKEGIVSAFTSIVNGIIRGINKVIEIPFNGINSALDKIRNVSIAGAQPFSGLVSRISVPQIPELEHGAVLKKGQVGLLEGNGAEAVVPLERNKYWIGKVADELKSQLFNLKGNFASGSNLITNSNTNNFTQIINAPKQPSRLELYRQTKNLLALKGG